MHVIATAGHVDHGKSTLVRALTGMEPDRWAEERRRGLTIDLGFAWTRLDGSGNGGDGTVAFVDVPGHERFVPNMLAGVGPAPAAMLVVAADEGWMPQSAEHLAALDALGVAHGLLAVTKSDRADPESAIAASRRELAGTSLAEVPAVAVSGRTGDGLPELRSALADLARRLPPPDVDADVRLWIDRAFTIHGAGTVVTGTLTGGTLRAGDDLVLASGARVRVRGLQALGEDAPAVPAVARVAVNLRGAAREDIRRGDALLTPGAWRGTSEMDIRLHGNARLHRELVVHVGSAAVPARVRPLGSGCARVTPAVPLPLRVGDRGLLRDPGAHRILAGFDVLDVLPPPLTRRGAVRARADDLAGPLDQLRGRGFVRAADARAMGWPEGGKRVGEWLVHEEHWDALTGRADALAKQWLAERPVSAGMPVETLRRLLDLPAVDVVPALLGELTVSGGLVVRPADALPVEVDRAVRVVEDRLARHPFRAPEADQLRELGLGPRELAAAVRLGRLIAVTDGVVLGPEAETRAATVLAGVPGPFTVSEARRALDTTRRVAVPLLERLDRAGVTVPRGDGRRELRP